MKMKQWEMKGGTWQLLKNGYMKNPFLIKNPWIIYSGCICTNIDAYSTIYHRNWLEAKRYKSSFMQSPRRNYFMLFKIHPEQRNAIGKLHKVSSLVPTRLFVHSFFSLYVTFPCPHPRYGRSFAVGAGDRKPSEVTVTFLICSCYECFHSP